MEGSVMQKAIWHITAGILMFLLLWLLASCSRDAEVVGVLPSTDGMTLDIGFRLPTRDGGELYEDGEMYENYIDVENGKYRIYFFDAIKDTLIARFDPSGFFSADGSNYCRYNALGAVPDGLVKYSSFKMVVLANWEQFNDKNIEVGKTTIEDICNAEWAQFDCVEKQELDKTRLMPFYGVRQYDGVTFKAGQATVLNEPVTLLRAMAKVEVLMKSDCAADLTLTDMRIDRYNAKGYCAPKDVFSQSDYDHNGIWEKDYVHTLHLVNDGNDTEMKSLEMRKVKLWEDGGKRYEKWIAYLPEYQNVGAGNAYSSIKAKFNIQLPGDGSHTIYFANYGKEGVADNSDSPATRLNIERNNIYRFDVECTSYTFNLSLHVSDWEGLYVNNFEYGDGQFTTPPAPWEDEINNDVEF